MGNQNQKYDKSVETFFLKYLPQLNYKLMLNDSILYKTVLCTIEDEGPVVCKLHFQKIEDERFKQTEYELNKIKNTFNLYKHPNILVYEKVFNYQKKALMGIRQFICHNLKEKLNRIPKLSIIEKKWLVFQLLCAVSQIHQEKMVHGDIKPDNIVVTSYNWLFLTDQMPYKPAYMKDDDLKLYNMFFGELDNNQRCYLAPERFKVDWDDSLKDTKLLEPQMDVFSAGCVIAEIFLDHSLFDLAHLQDYRKGLYDPIVDLKKKIKDPKIIDLILSMIDKDPSSRLPINDYILKWNDQIFPTSFSQVYYQLGAAFLRPQFLFSDQKVSLIRKYINSIWFTSFGKADAVISDQFNEPIDPVIFERIRDDTIQQFEAFLIPSNELFIFLSKNNLNLYKETEKNIQLSQEDKDSVIVIIHWIGSFIHSCFYPQSRICALEILHKIAIQSSIEMRLQFILPYVITMFEDDISKVKAKALEVCVTMFADILDQSYVTTLSGTDYKVIDNYILPAFLKLKNESQKDQYVQHVFVRYLPLFAQIGHRFLELSIASKFQKRQQSKSQITNQSFAQYMPEENNEEEDDEQDRFFTHNENLLQTSHFNAPRATIIIRDDSMHEKSHKNQDATEIFINYDAEYDKLRRIIQSIINDILSETDSTLQRVLLQNIGTLSIFFGRKDTIDNLIPLSNSCFNKKDFMLRMECLKGIPYIGLRVGQQTLAKYLLITCTQLLYDSEELVVFEMIKTLTKLLEFKLLSKSDSIENLEKLLPFLLHPNTWIRDETLKFVKSMADPQHQILTKAETYCLIRPRLKRYLAQHEKVFDIHGNDLNQSKLKPPLSRDVYEKEIKGTGVDINDHYISQSDKQAKIILQEVMTQAKQYFQRVKRDRTLLDVIDQYTEDFKFQIERIKQYRIVQSHVIAQLAGIAGPPGQNAQSQGRRLTQFEQTPDQYKEEEESKEHDSNNIINIQSNEYCQKYYSKLSLIDEKEVENMNYGLNKRSLNNNFPMDYETDILLQALNIIPDDPQLPLIQYKNPQAFTNLACQGLIVNSNLNLEQQSAQPSNLPQFNNNAKSIPVPVTINSASYYVLGSHHQKFNTWRPSGRLITTLYEHKSPVNCIAVTDDSQYFITGSRQDSMIHVWATNDIEKDVTSHSSFSISSKRQVNAITCLNNSQYFAVAGSQGGIDIYQMSRLDQESELRTKSTTIIKNPSLERQSTFAPQNDPNYTSIIKTLERKDEGDINLCTNMILPSQQQHLLAYTTQKGSLYFHDLRARYDVNCQYELFGCERGMTTSMCIGQDPYQLYFGTVGGYVAVYDLRYNVVASYYKHFQRAPINSIQCFHPSKVSTLNLNKSDYYSPLALISSGTNNYEISLLNLQTNDVEVFLTVDDSQSRENVAATISTVPSFQSESVIDNTSLIPKKYETNQSLFRRYLQSNRSSQHFSSLISLQQYQYLKNFDEEWFKHSKNRYMLLKTSYESSNACRKILVPRKFNNSLYNPETVSYAITGGNDKKLRFWDFQSLPKRSYYINTPNDDECQYIAEHLGDTYVVQEKVNQFKQFPQLNSNLISKQYDANLTNTNNVALANNSTYYGILNSMMQGQDQQQLFTEANGTRTSSFQIDQFNDQPVIYNFNGLAEWQHFNGLTMNQGCGVVGQTDASGGSSDYLYRDSRIISHQDCILDMAMIELDKQDPILITTGRDNTIKLWR